MNVKGSNYMKIKNVEKVEIRHCWDDDDNSTNQLSLNIKFDLDSISAEDLGKMIKAKAFTLITFEVSDLAI